MGVKILDVMPCLAGGTEWKMDVWQGSVMQGITLRAVNVLEPRSRSDASVGHLAVVSASGRTPSRETNTTGGMGSSYYIPDRELRVTDEKLPHHNCGRTRVAGG
jgi:hypothetical protein